MSPLIPHSIVFPLCAAGGLFLLWCAIVESLNRWPAFRRRLARRHRLRSISP